MNKQENLTNNGLDSNMSEVKLTGTDLTKDSIQNQMTDERQITEEGQLTEEQMARYVSDVLNDHARHLDTDKLQRLAAARQLAVAQLAGQQAQSAQHNGGHVLQWLGHHLTDYFGHHRAMSTALIAGIMMLTFIAAQQFDFNNNLENSDAFLLASELPPEAFADKGFDTWLDSKASY